MLIGDLLAVRRQAGDVGVEIEMEGYNIPHRDLMPYIWKREVDHSLRGESAEFVMRQPVKLKDLRGVLENLDRFWRTRGPNLSPLIGRAFMSTLMCKNSPPYNLLPTFVPT